MFKSFCVILSCCVVVSIGYTSECGLNQEIRCMRSCPPEKSCENRDIGYGCLHVVEPCLNRCVCKEGFVRNAEGLCIPDAQCEPICTGENEVYDFRCRNSCRPAPDTCLSFGFFGSVDPDCVSEVSCEKQCGCKGGFLREEEGSPCVPLCECSQLKNSPMCA